jgi:hypothetical protein
MKWLLLASLIGFPVQQPPIPQSPTDADRLAAPQFAQECQDAGEKFWQRYDEGDASFDVDYEIHYNREQDRCFVLVSRTSAPNPVLWTVTKTIYEAGDGTFIANGLWLWNGTEFAVNGFIGTDDSDPLAAQLAWFNDLMDK